MRPLADLLRRPLKVFILAGQSNMEGPGSVVGNVGRVFARQIQQRCEAKVITTGDAPLTVELTIAPGIGAEGFRIEDRPNGGVRIVGNDERGLVVWCRKVPADVALR